MTRTSSLPGWTILTVLLTLSLAIPVLAQEDGITPTRDLQPPAGDGVLPGEPRTLADPGDWEELTTWNPWSMITWGEKVVADFGTDRGLWLYDAETETWTRLSTLRPSSMIVADKWSPAV